jgi:hypothetical protein
MAYKVRYSSKLNGTYVTAGHFAGLLAAERRTAPLWWHLNVLSSIFIVVVLAKCKELHCLDFSEEILQGAGAYQGQTLNF